MVTYPTTATTEHLILPRYKKKVDSLHEGRGDKWDPRLGARAWEFKEGMNLSAEHN